MKNRALFAAITFAFTIAGACMGYVAASDSIVIVIILIIAVIGGVAAAASGVTDL